MWNEPQLFVGEDEPIREKFHPATNREHGWIKPVGGLWTSTYRPETQDSEWVEWCIAESFSEPSTLQWSLLTPKQDARVAIVDTLADLQRFLASYEYSQSLYSRFLDFDSLARDYDGMHLTSSGQWATRLSMPDNLYGWDCESTVWFRWCFEQVERIETPVLMLQSKDNRP